MLQLIAGKEFKVFCDMYFDVDLLMQKLIAKLMKDFPLLRAGIEGEVFKAA